MESSPPRVYWDADALIAGTHSPTGAAGVLLLAAENKKFVAIVAPQVLEEARRNLGKKLPQSLPAFDALLTRVAFEQVAQPEAEQRNAHLHLADASDVAHVTAAHLAGAAYLVTFNLRHYRCEPIARELGIRVLVPGDLLKTLRDLGTLPQTPSTS